MARLIAVRRPHGHRPALRLHGHDLVVRPVARGLPQAERRGAPGPQPLARPGVRVRLREPEARRGEPRRDRPLRPRRADGRRQALGRPPRRRPGARPDRRAGRGAEGRRLPAHLVQDHGEPAGRIDARWTSRRWRRGTRRPRSSAATPAATGSRASGPSGRTGTSPSTWPAATRWPASPRWPCASWAPSASSTAATRAAAASPRSSPRSTGADVPDEAKRLILAGNLKRLLGADPQGEGGAAVTGPPIIDVNVNLSRWPFRRLPRDETASLVAKLRAHGVAEAWAGSFDGLLPQGPGRRQRPPGRGVPRGRQGVRLVPFGSVNPLLPDWEEDLRRCAEEHRMPGIRLHPNYHGYTLDHPAFARLLGLAAERRLDRRARPRHGGRADDAPAPAGAARRPGARWRPSSRRPRACGSSCSTPSAALRGEALDEAPRGRRGVRGHRHARRRRRRGEPPRRDPPGARPVRVARAVASTSSRRS